MIHERNVAANLVKKTLYYFHAIKQIMKVGYFLKTGLALKEIGLYGPSKWNKPHQNFGPVGCSM